MEKSFYQAETLEEAIEIYFQSENELYAQIKNKIIEEVLSYIYGEDSWSYLKVLEIGPGGGIWTEFFLKKGAYVVCVDICEVILKGNQRWHPEAKFVLADATTLKLTEKFDLIFAKDVIEHLVDDQTFLTNMNLHLNIGGNILINTQNSFCLNYLIQGGYHFLRGNRNWRGWDSTHVRFYSVKSLKRKLKTAGFKPIKWFGSYYFPYRILADRLGNLEELKLFRAIELFGLYDKFPFNIIGWNIGVVGQKIKSI